MRLSLVALSLFGVLVGGCASDAGDGPQTGTATSAIIGGTRDASRGAVVAILGDDPSRALCTGTLVASAPAASTGWVLTAGHCVAVARRVVSGPDFAATGAVTLPIDGRFVHPSFHPATPTSSVDIGILRVTGIVAGVRPIAIVSPEVESLKTTAGAGVIFVGYGMRRPGTAASGNGPNTERISLAKTIAQVGGDRFESTYVSGGPCHGDEGGPALVTVGGADAILATSWFMTLDCAGRAISLRAHAFAPWVASVVASERTRLGAYGAADGVAPSTSAGGLEDAGSGITPPPADAASTNGASGAVADAAPAAPLLGAVMDPGDGVTPPSSRSAGADVSLPGTGGCAISPPALTDTVALWTALALVVALVRRRRMSR